MALPVLVARAHGAEFELEASVVLLLAILGLRLRLGLGRWCYYGRHFCSIRSVHLDCLAFLSTWRGQAATPRYQTRHALERVPRDVICKVQSQLHVTRPLLCEDRGACCRFRKKRIGNIWFSASKANLVRQLQLGIIIVSAGHSEGAIRRTGELASSKMWKNS